MKITASNDGPISGRYLALVREEAGLTQAQLAKRLTFSPASVSRIESGERKLTKEEFDSFLQAIGTEGARQLAEYAAQQWDEVERPGFDHPDRGHLWIANLALRKLRQLRSNPNLINAFVRQVDLYEKELDRHAKFLHSREHRIAFVGGIGVGKSTAICKLVGLVKPGESKLTKESVLETGGGRTTLCEVHIIAGPQYGLRIAPRPDESIRRDVEDYAEHLIQRTRLGAASGPGGNEDKDALGISKEVIRAIQNMAGLAPRHEKTVESGKTPLNDPALELAARHPKVGELAIEILSRMNLPHRNRRDEWYTEDSKATPMQWLQNIFKEVNNGKHPNFTLPERIDVVLPHPVVPNRQLPVTIIDTKGIDQTAERQDLECLFDDPRTLVVLCSKFFDAPEMAIQTLLRRVKDLKARNIEEKALILVLPRPEEALSVKDDHGCEAESDEEGYAIKRGHINLSLGHLGLPGLPVVFYNAKQEAAEPVRDMLITRTAQYRRLYCDSIERLSEAVDHLISNQENVQTQMIFQGVERRLRTWIGTNRELDWEDGQVQGSLLAAIVSIHHGKVRASVNRSGDSLELDYYHHLGYGARRLAAQRIGRKVEEFKITVRNAIDDEELAPARMFLERVVARLDLAANEAYLKIQEVAREAFRRELRPDRVFWLACQGRWGRGNGYQADIREMTAKQLASSYDDAHLAVRRLVMDEWARIVGLLEEMLEEREAQEDDSHLPAMIA
jgi:transcriptional regulator with XRE-family HTH domain